MGCDRPTSPRHPLALAPAHRVTSQFGSPLRKVESAASPSPSIFTDAGTPTTACPATGPDSGIW